MDRAKFTRQDITGRKIFVKDAFADKDAYLRVSSAKTLLMCNFPFWGFMALDLALVELEPGVLESGGGVETLATDGHHIFYSAAFIKSLRPGEVIFAIAHEIYHCLFGHTGGHGLIKRGKGLNHKIWGEAIDYVTNADLKESGIGEFITTIQILYDPKYHGWSAEAVYRDLLENQPDGPGTMDNHVDVEADSSGDGDKSGDGDSGGNQSGRTITVKVSQEELDAEQTRWQEMAQRAVAHINHSSEGAGSVPSHLKRLIDELNTPKVDWRAATRRFVTSVVKPGYSLTRPDKRTFGTGFILPGYRRMDTKLEIAVAIDTSGSVGRDALSKFVNELYGMLLAHGAYSIHVFCFEGDVDPATYKLIESSHKSPKEDLMEYAKQITGGGGTMFQSAWDFMRARRIKPRGFVMFTDGYPNDETWHGERDYCPSMFVTVGNDDGWKAPFGVTVPYEEA